MKKFLTVILSLLVIFSLFTLTAFAAESEEVLGEGSNIFSEVYEIILRHSDKILSALTLCVSLFLTFAYRKGILPLIKGGLNTLGTAVTKLKEETDKASEISAKTIAEARDKLTIAEEALSNLTEKLEVLEERLAAAMEEQQKASDTKIILESQIDMLYEIFMSSSIPLYQKESVGEKISAMKKRLADSEVNSND